MAKLYNEKELVFKEKPKKVQFQDLQGSRFYRWTVIGFAGAQKRISYWFCRCDCGKVKKVQAIALKNGNSKSCGCLSIERSTKHGHSLGGNTTKTYRSWSSMLSRCQNPKHYAYHDYGGRGITVCERWQKFENFLADMGEHHKGLTLDRIENDKGYFKENCRWATRKEQANNRRSNHLLTLNGITQNISKWSNETGIKASTIIKRIKRGLSIEGSLTKI